MGDVKREHVPADQHPRLDRFIDSLEVDWFGHTVDRLSSYRPVTIVLLTAGFAAIKKYWSRGRARSLQRAPGYGLLWFADFFYSRKSVEECLRPTIQDLQDEYAEALVAKRPRKATWVRIRGTWSFVCAAGLLTMASGGKQVVKIWKAVG
jgi:hypothetical protein